MCQQQLPPSPLNVPVAGVVRRPGRNSRGRCGNRDPNLDRPGDQVWVATARRLKGPLRVRIYAPRCIIINQNVMRFHANKTWTNAVRHIGLGRFPVPSRITGNRREQFASMNRPHPMGFANAACGWFVRSESRVLARSPGPELAVFRPARASMGKRHFPAISSGAHIRATVRSVRHCRTTMATEFRTASTTTTTTTACRM